MSSIWQNRFTLAIQGEISAYLYTAIRYRVIDYIAKEQSRTTYLASLPPITAHHTGDTDHSLREKLLKEQIEHVLQKLSPRVREVFELSRSHYLSHKDIAQRLNLSEHSVRSYMKEALRLLRSKLGSLLWIGLLLFCKIFNLAPLSPSIARHIEVTKLLHHDEPRAFRWILSAKEIPGRKMYSTRKSTG